MKRIFDMTEAERVARMAKEIRLRSNPMMDEFAIKLNLESTYGEIKQAQHWIEIIDRVRA